MGSAKSSSELRKAREARLAAASGGKTPETAEAPRNSSVKDKDEGQKTASTDSTPREVVAKVADITQLAENSAVRILGPFNEQSENPHWMVIANGEPLAKITLQDQENAQEIRSVFATAGYADAFIKNLPKLGLGKVLAHCKARPYVAAVRSAELYSQISESCKKEAASEFKSRAASYGTDLLNMLSLVGEAQRKNFILQNPLKDALYSAFKSAGVDDPIPHIERAFAESSSAHFDFMMTKAQAWMSLNPEALAQIASEVKSMPVREVKASTSANSVAGRPAKEPVPSSAANVPIATVTAGNAPTASGGEMSEKEALKKELGLRSRHLNHEVASKLRSTLVPILLRKIKKMFDRTKSYWNDSKERPLAPGATVTEEGSALVYADDGSGGLAVKPCLGAAGEVFAGWAYTDSISLVTEVLVETFVASAAAPFTQQLRAGNVALYNGGPLYDFQVYNVTTSTALAQPAQASFASAADALAGLLTVAAAVAANDEFRVTYRHTLTLEESLQKYQERSVNNRAQAFFHTVSVAGLEGEFFTSQFDTKQNYVVGDLLYTDVVPGFVTNQLGAHAASEVIGIVSKVPSANADGYLGVKFKAQML